MKTKENLFHASNNVNKERLQFSVTDQLPFVDIVGGGTTVELVNLEIQVVVSGSHAETTQTMRFHNTNNRDLEGNLTFPLPDNAVVCGYALDIGDKMVDGVVVEKKEARRILEAEERKKADPGIIEQVQGNVYRTRIYPIPANNSRIIRITYINELTISGNDAAYHLPLKHARKVDEVALRIEVVQAPVEPKIGGGLGNMTLTLWEDRWVSEAKLGKDMASEDLHVRLPDLPDYFQTVEKGPDGDTYFNTSVHLNENKNADKWKPQRIGIAWDASGSRRDISRDLDLLNELFNVWPEVNVDVVVFRDSIDDDVQSFAIGHGEKDRLHTYLKDLAYDGGTNLAALNVSKLTDKKNEAWFLFTDGVGTINNGLPNSTGARVFPISNQACCNSPFLQHIANEAGGVHINLLRVTPSVARDVICDTQEPPSISEATGCKDLHIRSTDGRFSISGRLDGPSASIQLTGPGAPRDTLNMVAASAPTGRIISRAWAGQRAQRIALIDDTNSNELLIIGRQYGLVTPGTSLLVLETLEQYLEYKIEPPCSLPDTQKAYHEQIEKDQNKREKKQIDHIEKVVSMWNARVEWWNKDFHADGKSKKLKTNKNFDSAFDEAGQGVAPCERINVSYALDDSSLLSEIMSSNRMVQSSESYEIGKNSPDGRSKSAEASISIKPWSPDTPYLKKMKEVAASEAYTVYLQQRKSYSASPAFFLDCGDYLMSQGQRKLGLRILSNLPELGLDNPGLMRMHAWRLQQAGELDMAIQIFEHVLKNRNDEPQSYRDLALAVGMRWERNGNKLDAVRAMALLYEVLQQNWKNFPEIELIVLMEFNRLIHLAKQRGVTISPKIDTRLIRFLDLDVRISMAWDTDLTDVDLHLFEPTGEHAYYGHQRTQIGGLVSRDFTQGYGPEEYVLKKAVPGKYTIKAHYYGSSQQSICGACTVIVNVFTNYGRSTEKNQVLTLRLEKPSNEVLVGEITIEKPTTVDTTENALINSPWQDRFKALEIGMAINPITEKIGQPASIQGNDDDMILVYKPQTGITVHICMTPRLAAIQQVMDGAKLDLLKGF